MSRLSAYAEKLEGDARKRYKAKLKLIGCVDPFLLTQASTSSGLGVPSSLPSLDASDLYHT